MAEGYRPSKRVARSYLPLSEREEAIGKDIVQAAYDVHTGLGPGLLEHVYEVCLAHELTRRGHLVERQRQAAITYDGIVFDEALRLDIVVDSLVICELKAVEELRPVYVAQVLTQLKLTGLRLGYLLNFNVELISHGIRRVVR
ncbi:MAG: GxxExxY protein [Anaerolinea sp.]|nr:GxxExxY protein [Anaerolinea sp.]